MNPKNPANAPINKEEQDDVLFASLCEQAGALFARKNRQYGGAYRWMGLIGTISEIFGIAMRLVNMVFRDFDNLPANREKIRDCLLDLHNYANMAVMCLDDENYYGISQ
jgi:hypothetical protein